MSIPLALTYDDVLIVPKRSTFRSRSEANTTTRLTKKLTINIPIVSSNMDTVTESEMAIILARLGGIGILHRFMTIEENAEEIRRVKRAQNLIIQKPYTIAPDKTVAEAKQFIAQCGVSGILVAEEKKLCGVISRRNILFAKSDSQLVKDIMTPRERNIVGSPQTSFEEAKRLFVEHKVDKLPLVDAQNTIVGLIVMDDMRHHIDFPFANLDEKGQLLVGASVGVHGDYIERAQALVEAGVDVLVIDIAHGHSDMMFNAVRAIRAAIGNAVELIAGNIATADAARELCEAGVDSIKVGVGPGTTCITRLVTGSGVPQLTAVMETATVAKKYGVPIIADGAIQRSGDIVKAIGAGADTVMLGGLLAGMHESPGVIMQRGDKKYKVCRGSASFAIAQRRKNLLQEKKDLSDVTPEGVEAVVPYKGYVRDTISQLIGGLRSGMSYTNSRTIGELQKNCDFVQITAAGMRESGPHDLQEVK